MSRWEFLPLLAAGTAVAASLFAQAPEPPASWAPTGKMAEARTNSCAVRLTDGRVLVAGGTGVNGNLSSAEAYVAEGIFVSAAPMNLTRSKHTCTLLDDGRVLAVGGDDSGAGSAEIYDPATDAWQAIPATGQARAGHVAVGMRDGRVLIAGGSGPDGPLASMEVFDPQELAMKTLDIPLSQPRYQHTASLLPDGRVLIAGGRNADGPLASTEIYNPEDGSVTAGPDLFTKRASHSATVLDDGRVLLAGGSDGDKELDTAEWIDAAATQSTLIATPLNSARRDHFAILIPGNGGVLLAGGTLNDEALAATEVYLPMEDTFLALGSLTAPRANIAVAAIADGTILAMGGANANGPQNACGLLLAPAVQFTASKFHPQETAQVSGSNFVSGTTVTFTLDLVPASGGAVSIQSRLITPSATAAGGLLKTIGGFAAVPLVDTLLGDSGKSIRVTAKAGTTFTATILAPVKVATVVALTTPQPQFEGLNGTVLGQLTRNFNPGFMTGKLSATFGPAILPVTTPVNTASLSLFNSYPLTNPPVGTQSVVLTYSGDPMHEPSTVSGAFTVVSKTPNVLITTDVASPQVGVPFHIRALVLSAGPVATAPAPTGNVSFLSSGFSLGNGVGVISRAGSNAQMSSELAFTALSMSPMNVSASYAGDGTYRAASSPLLTIPLQKAIPVLTTGGIPATFACGAPIPITALLTFPPTLGLTNRTVSFQANANAADGSVRLLSSIAQATLTPSTFAPGRADGFVSVVLPPAATSLEASFSGDTLLSAVRTAATRVSVQPVPVTVQLAALPPTVTNPVVLRAIVTSTGQCGAPTPTGSIEFLEAGAPLGPPVALAQPPGVTIVDGSSNTIQLGEESSAFGTMVVSRPVGPRSIQVRYSGDRYHQPGVSSAVTVTFQ
jgi:hypothetical protein